MIVVLGGGIGAAKFLRGLVQVVDEADVTVVVNTADDKRFFGLHVSPDIDTILYTLAGIADRSQGWGIDRDTFRCLEGLKRFGQPDWFRIGDRDLASHIHRSVRLEQGRRLTEITADMASALGVAARVLPMSDGRVQTMIRTEQGEIHFQDYLVARGATDRARGVRFDGIEKAGPTPEVLASISEADLILFAPSNPIISIGPILALCGVRDALKRSGAPVAAVSPIIAGRALRGPADRLMEAVGTEVSPRGVARLYSGLLDLLLVDRADAGLASAIEREQRLRVRVESIVMRGDRSARRVARAVLEELDRMPRPR